MVTVATLPKLPDLTAEQAEHWVAAALAEARALRQHDAQLFPGDDSAAALAAAKELHAAWLRWAEAAEALYEHLRGSIRSGRHVNGASDLDYAIGRTRAMLQITPESYRRSVAEVRRGETVPHEEIRRELRDRMEQRRAARIQ